MLTFFGMGKIKPDKADEFEKALQAYQPHLQAEEGTVEYAVYRGTKDPLRVAFYEIYKDEAANEAHHASPHVQEFLRILGECREEDVMMGFFEEIIAKR
jgi:quinol monooxygenase YgiN